MATPYRATRVAAGRRCPHRPTPSCRSWLWSDGRSGRVEDQVEGGGVAGAVEGATVGGGAGRVAVERGDQGGAFAEDGVGAEVGVAGAEDVGGEGAVAGLVGLPDLDAGAGQRGAGRRADPA